MQVSNYYDEKYFAWEKEAGEFGGLYVGSGQA